MLERSAIQRDGGADGFQAPAEVPELIETKRGSGEPLTPKALASMGQLLGRDFSDVKIHTDQTADRLNKDLSARAFTVGTDIFFSSGSYRPDSAEGKKVLGHELTLRLNAELGKASEGLLNGAARCKLEIMGFKIGNQQSRARRRQH